jgi:hypothetical protein
MIKLAVRVPGNQSEKDIRGKLVSLFDAVIEVSLMKRRASYIVHFWRERLTKSEQRNLLLILSDFIKQIQIDKHESSSFSEDLQDQKLPSRAKEILKQIRRI